MLKDDSNSSLGYETVLEDKLCVIATVNSVKLLFSGVMRGGLCISGADVVSGGVHH